MEINCKKCLFGIIFLLAVLFVHCYFYVHAQETLLVTFTVKCNFSHLLRIYLQMLTLELKLVLYSQERPLIVSHIKSVNFKFLANQH